MTQFIDSYDLVHAYQVDGNDGSEDNGILFTAEYDVLRYTKDLHNELITKYIRLISLHNNTNGLLKQNINSKNDRLAARDNQTAILIMSWSLNLDTHKEFSIIKNKVYHPRDIALFLFLKYGLLFYFPFIIVYFLNIIVSFCFHYKVRPTLTDSIISWFKTGIYPTRNKMVCTDGELIFWLVKQCFKLKGKSYLIQPFTMIADFIIKLRFPNGYYDAFMIYFGDQTIDRTEHPIRQLIKNKEGVL